MIEFLIGAGVGVYLSRKLSKGFSLEGLRRFGKEADAGAICPNQETQVSYIISFRQRVLIDGKKAWLEPVRRIRIPVKDEHGHAIREVCFPDTYDGLKQMNSWVDNFQAKNGRVTS